MVSKVKYSKILIFKVIFLRQKEVVINSATPYCSIEVTLRHDKTFFALNKNILYSDRIATDIPRVSLIETMWRGLFIFLLFFESQWFCVHCMVRLNTKL